MMSIEEKLSTNKYNVDEDNAHIEISHKDWPMSEKMRLVNACPARLYRLEADGSLRFVEEGRKGAGASARSSTIPAPMIAVALSLSNCSFILPPLP